MQSFPTDIGRNKNTEQITKNAHKGTKDSDSIIVITVLKIMSHLHS